MTKAARLLVGTVIQKKTNEKDDFPGCKSMRAGFYKITQIRESFTSKCPKDEDRFVYVIKKCTKNGSKVFKYEWPMSLRSIHEKLDSGDISLVGESESKSADYEEVEYEDSAGNICTRLEPIEKGQKKE